MDKATALELLNSVLPFSPRGEDDETYLVSPRTTISSVDHLLEVWMSVGDCELVIQAQHEGKLALVYVVCDGGTVEYTAPAPCGLTLQVMEALYTILPV